MPGVLTRGSRAGVPFQRLNNLDAYKQPWLSQPGQSSDLPGTTGVAGGTKTPVTGDMMWVNDDDGRLEVYHDSAWRRITPPRRFTLEVPITDAIFDASLGKAAFYARDRSYKVLAVSEIHSAKEDTVATMNLRVQGVANGSPVHATANTDFVGLTEIDMKGTINTRIDADLTTGYGNILQKGQWLAVTCSVDAGTLTDTTSGKYIGTVSITLEALTKDTRQTIYRTVSVTAGEDIPATGLCAFQALDGAYEITDVKEIHTVVQGAVAKYLGVYRCQGTEVFAAAGADQLLGDQEIDLTATINTTQTWSGTATETDANIIEPGDRVMVGGTDGTATPGAEATTTYEGNITITLKPYDLDDDNEEMHYIVWNHGTDSNLSTKGLPLFIAEGSKWQVEDIFGKTDTVETSAGTDPVGVVERCQNTEAAGKGDNLVTVSEAAGFDLDDTSDAWQDLTLVTTSNVHILDDGDRLVFYAVEIAAPTVLVALTEFYGSLIIGLRKLEDQS